MLHEPSVVILRGGAWWRITRQGQRPRAPADSVTAGRIVVAFGVKALEERKVAFWPAARQSFSLSVGGKPEDEAGAIPNLEAVKRANTL
jgi:hypothetical protein